MSVRVEVLNSAFWASPQYIQSTQVARIADTYQSIQDGRFLARREAWNKAVESTLIELSKVKPQAKIDPVDVKKVSTSFSKIVNRSFDSARDKFEAAFDDLNIDFSLSTTAKEGSFTQGRAKFFEGANILHDLQNDLAARLRTQFTAPQENRIIDQLEEKEREIVEGLIGNAGILDDPRAATIIYAPSQYWGGHFNQTLCSASFGNSDCAVKMDGLGNFTIKGVRLDATNITQATFSVAREAIQMAAAIYGVPVPRATGTSTGSEAAPSVVTDLESPVKRERNAAAAMQQLRLARLAMLETIIAQRKAIKTSDAQRAEALKIIKAVVEANRSLLIDTQ